MLRYLWLRPGDAGDYRRFDAVNAVAYALVGLGVAEYDPRPAGIEADGFRGNNYVSLYWGDAQADLVRELTPDEHADLRRNVERLTMARRVLWVRAGIGDVLTRVGNYRQAAERIRERGFHAPTAEIVQSSDLHRFWVRGYDTGVAPLFICWASESDRMRNVCPVDDLELALIQRELTALNNPPTVPQTEARVNQFVQDAATAFRRLAGREDRVATEVQKRCLDFQQGSSSKFWTVEVVGTTAFVTYGKIGSKGSTQIKEFRTPWEAVRFADKMIAEKTAKGYRSAPSTRYPGAPAHQLAAITGAAPPAAAQAHPAGDSTPAEGERHIDL